MTTEHLSHFDLRQMVVVNQSIDKPRLLQFIRLGWNAIEIEDGRFGLLLVDLDEVSSERVHSFESPSGPSPITLIGTQLTREQKTAATQSHPRKWLNSQPRLILPSISQLDRSIASRHPTYGKLNKTRTWKSNEFENLPRCDGTHECCESLSFSDCLESPVTLRFAAKKKHP